MKVRNGFVSNSSSSSFVILGIDTEEEMENLPGRLDSIYLEDRGYVTGIVIDHDEYLNSSTNFAELQKMAEEVSEALKVDISELELVAVTTYG
jgi:hypothetical protein